MKLVAVTTQDKAYYDKIGKSSIESFVKYWPETITLCVFLDDFEVDNHDNVVYFSTKDLGPDFDNFMSKNYKSRIKTFAKKAFSWIKMCEITDADRVIWVDSDVITLNKIPETFLRELCDDKTLASYLSVTYNHIKTEHGKEIVSPIKCGETGFYVMNTQHDDFEKFVSRYKQYYTDGLGKKLRRFYDGDVFGAVVTEFEKQTKFRDLGNKVSATVFSRSILSKYMTHFKGKVKKQSSFMLNT